MKRIHIIAPSPRSGTTLLAESMVACFDIDVFAEHEARVTSLHRGGNIYLSKSPADMESVTARLRFDPHFHVICIMRDPRDIIVSQHGKRPGRYWAPLRLCKEQLPAMRKLMRYPRFLLIRYEDLVADPDKVQALIQEHMPFLAQKAPFSSFHELAKPSPLSVQALNDVRPINASSVGRWRDHLPRIAGQLSRHGPISDILIEFGYEKDDSWLSALKDVEPDLKPSKVPDRAPASRARRWPWRRPIAKGYFSAVRVLAARAVGINLA